MKAIFIEPDYASFSKIGDKISTLHINAILPEVIGKWFTRQYIITGINAQTSEKMDMSIVLDEDLDDITNVTMCLALSYGFTLHVWRLKLFRHKLYVLIA